MSLTVAVAQFNATVGDVAGNARKIADWALRARAAGADLLLTPELALSGYPPEDLLLRPDFYRVCDEALAELATIEGIAILVGHPEQAGEGPNRHRYNAASLLRDGERQQTYRKGRLPNYEVFDEARYFDADGTPCVFDVAGIRCGVNICADVWEAGPYEAACASGAELMLVLNASPFHGGKHAQRVAALGERATSQGVPAVYANLVGGQDELVFDGGSFAVDATGRVAGVMPACKEALGMFRFDGGALSAPDLPAAPIARPREAELYDALVLGVRDYLGKNSFPGAIIGLSGGIDSALTLCVAVDALGPGRVRAVMMPSPYTAQMSLDDSRAMVEALGVEYDEIAIAPAMATFDRLLGPFFQGLPADTTEENLQARIRGMLLMALSNKTGRIVLTTGNKSEMAAGYATLYGDMAGGFAVIKDVYKTQVYRLSRYRNTLSPVIPENILVRPPSAELRPDQTDQDSLPPYEVLDAIIEAYMEEDASPADIVARGFEEATVRRIVRMLKLAEYKRRQAPLGVRVTARGFGKDWRFPITNRYPD